MAAAFHVQPGAAAVRSRAPLGREIERRLIASLLAGIRDRGAALVLRGEPGIGKSRLLAEAAAQARQSGISTLSTAGIQTEANLAFAGLHHLLRPVGAHAAKLSPVLSSALDSAFGLNDDPAPSPFRIAMAVLDLLSEAATDQPLLLLVEDAHWLDRPTADVLAFVARRLRHDPIVLLAATRDDYASPLLSAGLPEHRVESLTDSAAAALLEATTGGLPVTLRARVLRESAGNPLAPRELSTTSGRADEIPREELPLTERLEQAFGARVSELPHETRVPLLVTALSEQDDLDKVLAAAAIVSHAPVTLEMLEPAERAGIVELDVRSVRFRHPLMRSAVRQTVEVPLRRRAHQALAEVLQDDPDRRVWHRAALVSGPEETIAVELEDAGRRADRRGATHVAFTALRRAAELSDQAHRAKRLLAAAELAVELGTPELAAPLLREVGDDGGPVERARAMLIEDLVSPTQLRDVARATRIVAAAERAGAAGDLDLHLNLIWQAVSRAWWSDPDRTLARSSSTRPVVSTTRAIQTRASSPSTPTPILAGIRPRCCRA